MITSRGCGGSAKRELTAATMVMGLCSFEMSFWMTTAGQVSCISCPMAGSNDCLSS